MYTEDELYHHGIIGQKWGVRRYQNKGGSYTKKGLERYNKSKEKYDSEKGKLDEARKSGDKSQTALAKSNVKIAKNQLKKDYKQLKRDSNADEGKRLYSEGRTISGNNKEITAITVGGIAVSAIGSYLNRNASTQVESLAGKAIQIGAVAVTGSAVTKINMDNQKLRAYYGHSGEHT